MKATHSGPFEGVTFQVEGDVKQVWQQLSFLASLPTACGACGSTALKPSHRVAKGKYDYYEVVCQDCGHTAAVGQHAEGDGLFYKQGTKWLPPYRADEAA